MKTAIRISVLILAVLLLAGQATYSQHAMKGKTRSKRDSMIAHIRSEKFPMIDYHVHLKGGLTIEDVLAKSKREDVTCGIAPNCGLNFPITNDSSLLAYYESMKNFPVFLGMQAEGREWVKLFSKEAIAKFDYVFTDAMTFTDNKGKRTRIWINEEVDRIDPQAFMDMYVDRILGVLNNEPIDIYVNPTFLPDYIAARYDELWTRERMLKVIDAAVKHHIAIEFNDRYKIPSAAFIRLAKSKGVKFSFGTNNADASGYADLTYCKQMMKECNLQPGDMFFPRFMRNTNKKEGK